MSRLITFYFESLLFPITQVCSSRALGATSAPLLSEMEPRQALFQLTMHNPVRIAVLLWGQNTGSYTQM